MNNQQELGGAHALLQLGSKNKDQDKSNDKDKDSINQLEHHSEHDHGDEEDEDIDDSKATNQQINDAVEAAVMKYVGGNLDGDDKKSKKRLNPDEFMSSIGDFHNWTGFLEDGMTDPTNEEYPQHQNQQLSTQSHNNSQMSSQGLNTTIPSSSNNTPKRKKRKTLSLSQEIDPELTELDSNSEHDQLVRAAILETRELAKQLGSAYTSLSHLPVHQAQQVLAAMQNSAANNNGNTRKNGKSSDNDNNMMLNDSISNINYLVQLAKENGKQSKNFKPLDEQTNDSVNLSQTSNVEVKNFSHITSIEQLSDEASRIAVSWYKSQPESSGPRAFSDDEMRAVEYFIEGYCYLFKVDLKQVCQRIWTTERKKDNFWECLTKVLPYRSRASVYKHVRRGYHVFDVRGKWSREDDEMLTKLANTKQGNWKEIGAMMGRMPEDCRDRWRNYIKCGENRLMSRWAPEEEEKLKHIVSDMLTKLKLNTINWTLVSEAMDGTRSRIQCRYKWNKLVKRESVLRASTMDLNTKLWLFQKLKKLGYTKFSEIDWQLITKLYSEEHDNSNWLPSDFEHGCDKMITSIKNYKKIGFEELLNRLIEGNLTGNKDDLTLKHALSERQGPVEDEIKDEGDYMWR